jgi:outer membrane beta-barrel protein
MRKDFSPVLLREGLDAREAIALSSRFGTMKGMQVSKSFQDVIQVMAFGFCCSLIASFAFAQASPSEDVGELSQPKIIALQKRPNKLTNEFSGHLGYLPQDHFNTYVNFGGAYTTYFNDYIGWEVFNANIAQASSTGLESFLLEKFQSLPDASDVIKYWVTSNIVYTPLFMKHLFRDQRILWGDLSFIAGGGITRLQTNGNANTINIGFMMRFFNGPNWISKLDLRQLIFLSSAVKPNLQIGFSLGYNFGGNEPQQSAPLE